MPLERLEHRITTHAQQPVHALDVRLEVAAANELVHGRLRHERRRDVRRHRERLDLRGERRRHDVIPHADAGRDRLRERRRVHDVLAALELEQRRLRGAFEAHEPVRVVLDHGQLVLARDLDDPAAAGLGEGAAARVLERRDGVQEGGLRTGGERLFERVGHQPLVVHRDADHLGAEAAQDLDRPVVRRRLEDDAGAGLDELLGEEDERLERPARDDDAARLDAVALGDPFAQRAVAAAGAVREDGLAIALDRRLRAVGELVHREALGRRNTAREADDVHRPRLASYLMRLATSCATSVGVAPTSMPFASSASFFATAVPDEPEMIAPAWPMALPGGAENPAM